MAARNPARYLAPVALAATIAGGYLVVHDNVTAKHPAQHRVHRVRTTPRGKYAKQHFYTVQPNDNLTSISRKTGVPLRTLESLNPAVNPDSLQTGQRIVLRR